MYVCAFCLTTWLWVTNSFLKVSCSKVKCAYIFVTFHPHLVIKNLICLAYNGIKYLGSIVEWVLAVDLHEFNKLCLFKRIASNN